MINTIDIIRREATQQLDQKKRSELGQYMTPTAIAAFMASLFGPLNSEAVHVLDAGAGIGSLTASFLEKCFETTNLKVIDCTCYEIDKSLLNYLSKNLLDYGNLLKQRGLNLNSNIYDRDFIEDAVAHIVRQEDAIFTHAILNPPYKKINSKSDHREFLRLVDFETVNLYSAFVGLSLLRLKDKGELVAIIPRSFCNGNYYKAFRELLINHSSIKQIHVFDKRDQAFKDDDVLQENVIIHLVNGDTQGNVIISTSTNGFFEDLKLSSYDFTEIVKPDDSEFFIHIPTVENYLKDSENINYTLRDLELEVSTGPVVDFRSKEHIFREPVEGAVPLLYPTHFNGKEIDWPKVGKKPNAILVNDQTKKLLYPKGFFTVIRRFSSKEEKQRIVARVINPYKLDFDYIGIENHLNVLHYKKEGISEDLAYGIAAYLNSSYVDTHFRSFNGHTQVNATDLKQMKYPSRDILINLGAWAKTQDNFDQAKIDKKIEDFL